MNFDDIKIERGVAVPGPRRTKLEHPWSSMEVGDSFFLPYPEDLTDKVKWRQSIYAKCIKHWGHGGYAARTENDRGLRVWRKK